VREGRGGRGMGWERGRVRFSLPSTHILEQDPGHAPVRVQGGLQQAEDVADLSGKNERERERFYRNGRVARSTDRKLDAPPKNNTHQPRRPPRQARAQPRPRHVDAGEAGGDQVDALAVFCV
jgi:hypothetical protein